MRGRTLSKADIRWEMPLRSCSPATVAIAGRARSAVSVGYRGRLPPPIVPLRTTRSLRFGIPRSAIWFLTASLTAIT